MSGFQTNWLGVTITGPCAKARTGISKIAGEKTQHAILMDNCCRAVRMGTSLGRLAV